MSLMLNQPQCFLWVLLHAVLSMPAAAAAAAALGLAV
jgi:hypothetical protein